MVMDILPQLLPKELSTLKPISNNTNSQPKTLRSNNNNMLTTTLTTNSTMPNRLKPSAFLLKTTSISITIKELTPSIMISSITTLELCQGQPRWKILAIQRRKKMKLLKMLTLNCYRDKKSICRLISSTISNTTNSIRITMQAKKDNSKKEARFNTNQSEM